MDFRPTPGEEASRETPPLPGRQNRGMARASMREELLALFRNTERTARASSGMHAVAGELRLNATSQSTYLRRFLQQGARSPSLAASGLAGLDDRLDGGFGPGLHLVLGPPGAGKTAFLDSVAWEAVCRERPVLYYTLREGGLGTWERLITALGHILGGPTVSLKAWLPKSSERSAALTWLGRPRCCHTYLWSRPFPPTLIP
jgi:hypothetical protein